MSLGRSRRKPTSGPTAEEVEEFLRRHPWFFQDRLDLLEILRVPHPCGEAVSLVARQTAVLRERNQRMERQLGDILKIARDNDALYHRLHHLTLTLLDAAHLEDALAGLKWSLHHHFQADFVAVRIAQPRFESPVRDLALREGSAVAQRFASVWELGGPRCGVPERAEARWLFGQDAPEVASQALIPLRQAGLRGLLAIGSRDPERFQAGLGSLFLTRLGEIVSARLAGLLDGRA
ncbi:DUF484 family protein [Candidatus Methylocalor cossyra]|uniref:DUF484 family protein n=1 Tax=Candidatus Methylocalor cossyra TaxID=3108543 RepID=A0ABM9NEY9_9GAMM